MKVLTMGCGFITNSSSVVHYFDKALLKDPDVAAFMDAYEAGKGFVGSDMWSRSSCDSFLVNKEQKEMALGLLAATEYGGGPGININDENEMILIYGDEHYSFVSILCEVLREAAERIGSGHRGQTEYN